METESPQNSEQDTDWAKDIIGDYLHISQAVSGANNYFCLGCDKKMLAAKGQIKKHYFRHVVKDVDNSKVECVHASRVYREKLAYFYFQRTKTITVPAVYKYPPKGIEGNPILLKEKETIIAHKVEKEVTFYEDENGVIHRGKNSQIDERYLWVRPDAVFFDKDDKPILFLEFVITHKPDTVKLNKLQRLGIDTVQIIIPKLSEEELEKTISKVSKIKWAYNEIESTSEYTPIQSGNTEGIPQIDEEQSKLFEESYSCRTTQIGNLIRSINRSVESQQYKNTERLFESEIQRIEVATRDHQSKLDDLQAGIEREIHSELTERREQLEERRRILEEADSNLEERYFIRRAGIIEIQADTRREIELRHSIGRTEEDIRREFGLQEASVDDEQRIISRQEQYAENDTRTESDFADNFDGSKSKLNEEFGELESDELRSFEKLRKGVEEKGEELIRLKSEIENGLRSEFEREYQQIAERIDKRDIQSNDELSDRIKTILELRGLFYNYDNEKSTLERYKKGISIIKDRTWEKWNR